MPTVSQSLTRGLDPQVRGLVHRRADFMVGQLNYLKQKQHRQLQVAEHEGWSIRKLEVVCWLNSFFQIVISPLAASATKSAQLDLGGAIPIHYGEKIRFDAERRENFRDTERAFYAACHHSGIDKQMLSAHRAEDLVYLIFKRASAHE